MTGTVMDRPNGNWSLNPVREEDNVYAGLVK